MSDASRLALATPPRIILANAYPFASLERIPPSCSASEHVFVILRGKGSINIGGTRWILEPGTVAVAPWGRPWALQSAARPALALISIHLHFLPWHAEAPERPACWLHGRADGPAAPAAGPVLGSGVLALPAGNRVAELAQRAVEAWELRGDPRREPVLRGIALQLAGELLPADGRPGGLHPAVDRIRELLDWLRFAPFAGLTRADLERRSGLGRSALGAAFRAATGLPPGAWLMERRLAEADRLLRGSTLPVAAIAARTGFDDPFHFSRRYRQRFGCSPRQARNADRLSTGTRRRPPPGP